MGHRADGGPTEDRGKSRNWCESDLNKREANISVRFDQGGAGSKLWITDGTEEHPNSQNVNSGFPSLSLTKSFLLLGLQVPVSLGLHLAQINQYNLSSHKTFPVKAKNEQR